MVYRVATNLVECIVNIVAYWVLNFVIKCYNEFRSIDLGFKAY